MSSVEGFIDAESSTADTASSLSERFWASFGFVVSNIRDILDSPLARIRSRRAAASARRFLGSMISMFYDTLFSSSSP